MRTEEIAKQLIKDTIKEIGSKVNIDKVKNSIPEVYKVIEAVAKKVKR